MISGQSADELLVRVSRKLLQDGVKASPRGLETVELRNAWLELADATHGDVTLPERALKEEYRDAEMAWYASGSLLVADIAKHSSFWAKLANRNGTVNSNYGFLVDVEPWGGRSQYQWCLDRLREDVDTRQAVLNYNQPRHKFDGNKDFVCTIAQTFRHNDGALDSLVHMRSNDLVYGFTYDVSWFTKVQQRLAADLGLRVGAYSHLADSLHAYAKHYPLLERMAEAKL